VKIANNQLSDTTKWLSIGGIVVVVLLVAMLWPTARKPRQLSIEEQLAARPPGSFPVPPMDLQVPPSPRARRAVAERASAAVGGGDSESKEV
jgi:NADH-quinone oxidoreductase subunit H